MISAWFLSDLHLKDLNERRSVILLRFLHSLLKRERFATHLYLVGDIFDFWVGDHDHYTVQFQPIVDAILELKKQGVQVTYFEGNHDVHVKKFWEGRLGIPCFIEEKYDQLGHFLVRIEHGDLINPNDTTYLKYRSFVRSPRMERLAQLLPANFIHYIGKKASRKSRKRSSIKRRDSEADLRQMIRRHAEKSFDSAPFDLIITGHMHVRDDHEFERGGRVVRSVNLGSWFDEPLVFHLTDSGAEWVKV